MPLSEHEQRQLEQIERALYAEDPKFAQAVRAQGSPGALQAPGRRGGDRLPARRRPAAGRRDLQAHPRSAWLASWSCWPARCGRCPAGGTCPAGATGRARRGPRDRAGPRTGGELAGRRAGFMERLEERWRRRQERDR